MNRLLKKKEKSTQLSLKCRNITQDEINAMQEEMEREKEKLEMSKKQSQIRIMALDADKSQQTGGAEQVAKKPSNIAVVNQKNFTGGKKQSTFQVQGGQVSERAHTSMTNNQMDLTEGNKDTQSVSDSDRSHAKERHPLLPPLSVDEIILEEVSISSKLEALCCHKMN